MIGIRTIAQAVDHLITSDIAVLCLDTCDFIDVVRGVAEGFLSQAESFRRMRERLATDANSLQVVVTYLVRHEWEQNKDEAIRKVGIFLRDQAQRIDRIGQARRLTGLSVPFRDEVIYDPVLSDTLINLAETILDHSITLAKQDLCIFQALDRVMSHRRPSHKNHIKDSINWEHYLELARQLKSSGHGQPRIFVSANKEDFWADPIGQDKVRKPTINLELEAEATAAGLQFFGKLDAALGVLGI